MNILKKIGKFLLFLFGIYMILCGVTHISESPVFAILYTIGGLCCTPLYLKIVNKYAKDGLFSKWWIRAIIIIAICVVSDQLFYGGSNEVDTTKSDTQIEEQTEESGKSLEEIKAEYIESTKEYSYEEIFRNSEEYYGKPAVFKGQISQVQEDGGDVMLHVNVTQDEYGYWDDDMEVALYERDKEKDPDAVSRFMEDDIITVYGDVSEPFTYTTIMGEERTIPAICARYIKLEK